MRTPIRDLAGLSIGIELAISIVGTAALGNWADKRWHTAPWLALLGFTLGTAAGLRSLFRFTSKTDTPPPQDGGPTSERPTSPNDKPPKSSQ